MNYQTRLGEYLQSETAPVGSGPANRSYEQLNLSVFKDVPTSLGEESVRSIESSIPSREAPTAYDPIESSGKGYIRKTARVTQSLDELLDAGIPLTSGRMMQECKEKKVALGTINIPTENITDVEAITYCIRKLLRKSDHVYQTNGSIMILAPVSDKKGLSIVFDKIAYVMDAARELKMTSAMPEDIHMTYQPDARLVERQLVDLNTPEGGVELMDLALGKEAYDPTKQVYLSSSGSLDDVKNYINMVHALNPTLLPELEIVFACTNEFAQLNYSQLSELDVDLGDSYFDQRWHLQRFNVTSGNRHVELELDHLIDEESFVVIGYEPGKPFVYQSGDKKIVPQEDSG